MTAPSSNHNLVGHWDTLPPAETVSREGRNSDRGRFLDRYPAYAGPPLSASFPDRRLGSLRHDPGERVKYAFRFALPARFYAGNPDCSGCGVRRIAHGSNKRRTARGQVTVCP